MLQVQSFGAGKKLRAAQPECLGGGHDGPMGGARGAGLHGNQMLFRIAHAMAQLGVGPLLLEPQRGNDGAQGFVRGLVLPGHVDADSASHALDDLLLTFNIYLPKLL